MYSPIIFTFQLVLIFQISQALVRDLVPLSKLTTCRQFVTETSKCEHYFPIDYIKNYSDEIHNVYIKLYVLSYNDANIILTSDKGKAECRIVIGGWYNTQSTLNCHGEDLDSSDVKQITSPMWPIEIRIRQTTYGLLDVSIPGIAEPLLSARVPNIKINYICLHGFKETNRWFYNCSEENDQNYKMQTDRCNLISKLPQTEAKDNSAEASFDERFGRIAPRF